MGAQFSWCCNGDNTEKFCHDKCPCPPKSPFVILRGRNPYEPDLSVHSDWYEEL